MLTNERLFELKDFLAKLAATQTHFYAPAMDTYGAIDELLALRSLRDAGDDEIEDLARHADNGIGLDWYWSRSDCDKASDYLEKLKSACIARGQQLREAREEIKRLKNEMTSEQQQPKDCHCGICGLPMLPSESMFYFHGYSESCEDAKLRIEGER